MVFIPSHFGLGIKRRRVSKGGSRIIVFNGGLELPAFVKNMVCALSQEHQVVVMGFSNRLFPYKEKGVLYFPVGSNKVWWRKLFRACVLWVGCIFRHPKAALKNLMDLLSSASPKTFLAEFNTRNSLSIVEASVIHIQWASHLKLFTHILDANHRQEKIIVSLRGRLINVAPVCNDSLAAFYSSYFPKVDGFHAVSKAIAKESQKYGAVPAKIRVIYSGVDLRKLETYRKKDWTGHNLFRILSVGRHHWKKGYCYALDAMKVLINKGICVYYTILAGGELPEEILYHVKDLGLEEYVSLVPEKSQEEVFRYMQHSDVFLLPSVEEGIANVVLEAMAIGLPVVSSDCGGMREVIEPDINGLIFSSRDVNAMANAIQLVCNMEPKEREQMANRARRVVEQYHNLDVFSREFLDFYAEIEKSDLSVET